MGGKRQDAIQSQDSCSIYNICTGTSLLCVFKYCGCGFIGIAWSNDTVCVILRCNVPSAGPVFTQILPALPADDLRRQLFRTYQIPEGDFIFFYPFDTVVDDPTWQHQTLSRASDFEPLSHFISL